MLLSFYHIETEIEIEKFRHYVIIEAMELSLKQIETQRAALLNQAKNQWHRIWKTDRESHWFDYDGSLKPVTKDKPSDLQRALTETLHGLFELIVQELDFPVQKTAERLQAQLDIHEKLEWSLDRVLPTARISADYMHYRQKLIAFTGEHPIKTMVLVEHWPGKKLIKALLIHYLDQHVFSAPLKDVHTLLNYFLQRAQSFSWSPGWAVRKALLGWLAEHLKQFDEEDPLKAKVASFLVQYATYDAEYLKAYWQLWICWLRGQDLKKRAVAGNALASLVDQHSKDPYFTRNFEAEVLSYQELNELTLSLCAVNDFKSTRPVIASFCKGFKSIPILYFTTLLKAEDPQIQAEIKRFFMRTPTELVSHEHAGLWKALSDSEHEDLAAVSHAVLSCLGSQDSFAKVEVLLNRKAFWNRRKLERFLNPLKKYAFQRVLKGGVQGELLKLFISLMPTAETNVQQQFILLLRRMPLEDKEADLLCLGLKDSHPAVQILSLKTSTFLIKKTVKKMESQKTRSYSPNAMQYHLRFHEPAHRIYQMIKALAHQSESGAVQKKAQEAFSDLH